MNELFIYLAYFLVLVSYSNGYFITVDAHAEECFFEKVEAGTKLGLTFQISEGGFLDIDVRILGPDAKPLYEEERQTSGKYTFAAHYPGMYTFCFSNKMSTMTPKVVMFDIAVGEVPSKHSKDVKSENPIEDMIKELTGSLTAVKQEQEYMLVRDRIHKGINESTNSRVVLWSFFEAFISLIMSVGQVYYLKRFFEVRRVV